MQVPSAWLQLNLYCKQGSVQSVVSWALGRARDSPCEESSRLLLSIQSRKDLHGYTPLPLYGSSTPASQERQSLCDGFL